MIDASRFARSLEKRERRMFMKMRDIETVLRKRTGKEAAAIFIKMDKMYKQRKSPAEIKTALAADLFARRSKETSRILVIT
jgi:hypothetical protein